MNSYNSKKGRHITVPTSRDHDCLRYSETDIDTGCDTRYEV